MDPHTEERTMDAATLILDGAAKGLTNISKSGVIEKVIQSCAKKAQEAIVKIEKYDQLKEAKQAADKKNEEWKKKLQEVVNFIEYLAKRCMEAEEQIHIKMKKEYVEKWIRSITFAIPSLFSEKIVEVGNDLTEFINSRGSEERVAKRTKDLVNDVRNQLQIEQSNENKAEKPKEKTVIEASSQK